MRKSLWIIIAVFFAAIGTPNAHAQVYDATFTCYETCITPIASPMTVSFPSPTIDVFYSALPSTINVGPLGATDVYNDTYTYIMGVGCTVNVSCLVRFDIYDAHTMLDSATSISGLPYNVSLYNLNSSGTLSFTSATPEPNSAALMLTGVGLLGLMMRRILA